MLLAMQKSTFVLVLFLIGALSCAAQSPEPVEVAPGISLPTAGDATVFALDQTSSGPFLIHIKPHELFINTHAPVNYLRAQVFAGPHQTSQLRGIHSETALASTKAVFYVRIVGENAEIDKTRVHLLWLEGRKEARNVAEFSNNIFGGQHRRNLYEVACSTRIVEHTNWLKLTPNEPLSPGEFAVVVLPADVNQPPTAAFDFSVSGAIVDANPYAPREDDKLRTDPKKN
jgi:hypothetical protein